MTTESIIIVLVATIIGICYLLKIRSYDIYEKEPFLKLLLVSLSGGIFSVVCSLFIYEFFDVKENFTDAILKIGIIEEFSKLIALIVIFPIIRKEFNEIVDGIIYITAVALGFSIIENILYSFGSEEPYVLLFKRSVFSVLGHISFSGYMGIAFFIHKRIKNNFTGIIISVAISALAHGFYDGVLFTKALNSIFMLVFIALLVLQFRFLRISLCFSPFRKDLSFEIFKPSNRSSRIYCCNCRKEQISRIYEFNDISAELCSLCNNILFDDKNTKKLYRFFRPVTNWNLRKNNSGRVRIISLDKENKVLYDTSKRVLSADSESLGKWIEQCNISDKKKVIKMPFAGFILQHLGLKYIEEKKVSSENNKLNIPA